MSQLLTYDDALLAALYANPDAERIVFAAFLRHTSEHHNADYEVCDDPQCQAAYALELRLVEAML